MADLASLDKIKVINSFVSPKEAASLARYIDCLESTKPEACNLYQNGRRVSIQFGFDLNYGLDPEYKFFLDLELLSDLEQRKLIVDLCAKVMKKTKELFKVEDELFISAFWLAKQYRGATIPPHNDTDNGENSHYIYSAIVYLNQLKLESELSFLDLNHSVKPNLGDLVVFPTQTTGSHTVPEINENRYSLVLWMTANRDLSFLGGEK